jgi:hypothetical protein
MFDVAFMRQSGITIAQREVLIPALLSLGATFSPNLDERCTHLIVPSVGGVDVANSPKLAACTQDPLRQYVWVVTSAWLAACQAQRCRVPEHQFMPSVVQAPVHSSADAWLRGVSQQIQSQHNPHQKPEFERDLGDSALLVLPPSSLFLDDELQKQLSQPLHKSREQQLAETLRPPSKTRGWWINESSAAHVLAPLSPVPYVRVAELMSLSSSDPPLSSQELQPPQPSSQLDSVEQGLEEILSSPLAASKAFSQSPASSMSGSRTSQGKRKKVRSASDSSAAMQDTYCAVERLMDERFVTARNGCFSSAFVTLLSSGL